MTRFACLLLCLLVLSWSTCPCVMARALGIGAGGAEVADDASPCECCCHHAEKTGGRPAPTTPEDCPCCSSGGSIRDLPPQGGDASIDVPDGRARVAPVLRPEPAPSLVFAIAPGREATGPPPGCAPTGCPVGIVRIIS
jgi:hypothetical protein